MSGFALVGALMFIGVMKPNKPDQVPVPAPVVEEKKIEDEKKEQLLS